MRKEKRVERYDELKDELLEEMVQLKEAQQGSSTDDEDPNLEMFIR